MIPIFLRLEFSTLLILDPISELGLLALELSRFVARLHPVGNRAHLGLRAAVREKQKCGKKYEKREECFERGRVGHTDEENALVLNVEVARDLSACARLC